MIKFMKRLYVEKKSGFDTNGRNLLLDIKDNLNISSVNNLRIVNRYDINGLDEVFYNTAKNTIFSEPNIDICYDDKIENDSKFILGVKFLSGQYDPRSAFAEECSKIMNSSLSVKIKTATIYMFYGDISEEEFQKIKTYLINPVECVECEFDAPENFDENLEVPETVETIQGFVDFGEEELNNFLTENGFAMTIFDIKMIRDYFKDEEKRNPTITELKVIDTYWSDHCRHTTFMTKIENVEIKDKAVQKAFDEYVAHREKLGIKKDMCLMDIATVGAKYIKSIGKLSDLDESEEINACSINIDVDINFGGVNCETEKWLLMFKNETHNHPTEIEPFGGASTCLGGAIRDPLSGRSYVFSAMRVTGSGDPRTPFEDTIKGKLPQRTITKKAASGYSSYGNQIGLATGGVYEIYDEDYVAKRMEVGAVVGACPKSNVVRERPSNGDIIVLLGGRTGRDGIGGATGSSKVHTEESTEKSSSEVQKGNPIVERKIQRLFSNKEVTTLIKRCNDFGAGGVCVAIGELADSLEVNLNKVPKKYDGLDGTELAISESQERMAVVIDKKDEQKFLEFCKDENLEATVVAKVTDTGRLVMKWNEKSIFDVKREFLDTNGYTMSTDVVVEDAKLDFFDEKCYKYSKPKETLLKELSCINVCSKKGLSENFDSTIGAGAVLMPFGGKNMITEPDGMAYKIPVSIFGSDTTKETKTTALMTYGYNPKLAKQSTYHAGIYSVVEAVSKMVCLGCDYKKTRLSNQEYFERMIDKYAYGKPFSAILGVLYASNHLKIASIGGKDSMSGNFKDMKVPPTIITFAVNYESSDNIISPEFKSANSKVVLIKVDSNEEFVPNFDDLGAKYDAIYENIKSKNVLSAKTVTFGGIGSTIAKMCLGNGIGANILEDINLIKPSIGDIVLEVLDETKLKDIDYILLGETKTSEDIAFYGGESVSLDECMRAFTNPLESVFRTAVDVDEEVETISSAKSSSLSKIATISKPRVFIPVFPGTNCENDTRKVFDKAGAESSIFVFKNLTENDINNSIEHFVKIINNSQIIAIPGGFSASDEPDGSAKFIATVFRNERVSEAVMDMLYNRDGLMIGICNGFQALVKLGLLPYGEIRDLKDGMPTLTYNKISRHISCMSKTRIASNMSPWLNSSKVGDTHMIAMSHGEGRFVCDKETLVKLIENGQIATQYVDELNKASMLGKYNPNGSTYAIEGITSVDGRILGKMGHSERVGQGLYKNITGNLEQNIFENGVKYYL